MADEDVDAMLDKALDKIEETDKKNGSAEDMIKDKMSKNKNSDDSKKRRSRSRSKSTERSKKRRRHSSSESSSSNRSSRSKDRSRKRRSRSRSKDRRRKRSSSRDRDRRRRSNSRDRNRRRRSRSNSRSHRNKNRSRSRSSSYSSRNRRSSRSPPPRPRVIDHRGSPPRWRRDRSPPRRPVPGPERRDVMPFTARRSPPPNAKMDMTVEERDDRTVFVQQLARDTRPRDLEEFFSAVGHVRDVRIITDSKTRRSKGIAYVEFWEREAVPLALGLGGQRLLGAPLIIQATMAHMNRDANRGVGGALGFAPIPTFGKLKLCVSNLHPSINEDMLGAIFDPFGKIDRVEIPMADKQNNKGYGYVSFRHADDAKRALEQLNGFELATKPMRVTSVEENAVKNEEESPSKASNGRQPQTFQPKMETQQTTPQKSSDIPTIATQCFMLSNMFDPTAESEEGWDFDVRDDVIDECTDHGGVVHIFVDKASSQGNVYVKCPTVEVAYKSVNALHGRWFAGKVITANYVPVDSYSSLFPDSRAAVSLLKSRPRT